MEDDSYSSIMSDDPSPLEGRELSTIFYYINTACNYNKCRSEDKNNKYSDFTRESVNNEKHLHNSRHLRLTGIRADVIREKSRRSEYSQSKDKEWCTEKICRIIEWTLLSSLEQRGISNCKKSNTTTYASQTWIKFSHTLGPFFFHFTMNNSKVTQTHEPR